MLEYSFPQWVETQCDEGLRDPIDDVLALVYRDERTSLSQPDRSLLARLAMDVKCSSWHFFHYFQPQTLANGLLRKMSIIGYLPLQTEACDFFRAVYAEAAFRKGICISQLRRGDILASDMDLAKRALTKSTQGALWVDAKRNKTFATKDGALSKSTPQSTLPMSDKTRSGVKIIMKTSTEKEDTTATDDTSNSPMSAIDEPKTSSTPSEPPPKNANSSTTGSEVEKEAGIDELLSDAVRVGEGLRSMMKLMDLKTDAINEENAQAAALESIKRTRAEAWSSFSNLVRDVDDEGAIPYDDLVKRMTAVKGSEHGISEAETELQERRAKRRRVEEVMKPYEEPFARITRQLGKPERAFKP
ncbi:hypothetical protein GGR57DRAFT_486322 [Xylariaceae sp. FL1272]|nr:hypothetical protein GGR57DRAFT_486322 [Xylariaceae sp. FL1272]